MASPKGKVVPFRFGPEIPDPPAHLSAEAREWWSRIAHRWEVDARGQLLLRSALECWDRYCEAKAMLDQDGPVVRNPQTGHAHVHPAHQVARDSIREFRQLWRQLGLEGEPMDGPA